MRWLLNGSIRDLIPYAFGGAVDFVLASDGVQLTT
jgi:hypothetical protein